MSEPTGGSGSGTQVESLEIRVNADEAVTASTNLDKLGTATVRAVQSLDGLSKAVQTNTEWTVSAHNKWAQLEAKLLAEAQAQKEATKAKEAATRATEARIDAAQRFLVKLEEEVKLFGKSAAEMQRYKAAQLGVSEAAEGLIQKLEKLTKAQQQNEIQQKRDIELHKEQVRAHQERRRLEEERDVWLHNQRQKARADYEAWWGQMLAVQAQNDAKYLAEEQRRVDREKQIQQERDVWMNNKRQKERADYEAWWANKLRTTEQHAQKEAEAQIKWAETGLREKTKTLESLAKYKANPTITQETIDSRFSKAAQADLQNYNKILADYHRTAQGAHELHRNGERQIRSLSDAWQQMSFSTSRARSELIVIAHEMVTGNWRRVPGSMMVLGEYTNLGAVAFSGMGAAIIGVTAALAGMAVAVGAGILQQHEMNNALNRTNMAAGATINTLTQMAESAGGIHGNMSDAYEATTKLAASGLYTAEQIGQISKAATEIAHIFRVDVNTTIKEFEALVVKGSKVGAVATYGVTRAVQLLDEKYHFLTATQMAYIVQLEAEGNQRKATAEAIRLFSEEGQKAAERAKEYTGYIQRGWHSIAGAIDTAIQKMKDWGATDTLHQKLKAVNDQIRESYDRPSGFSTAGDNRRAELEKERKALEAQIKAESDAAEKHAAKKRAEAEAKRELATMAIEDVSLMRKTQSERERALDEHRQRVAIIEKSMPGWSKEVDKEKGIDRPKYLAEREAAIIRAHTRKTGGIKDDGRKADLQSALDHEQKEYELVKRQTENELKMVKERWKKGAMGQQEAYEASTALRASELAALDQLEQDKLAILNKYKPKNANDKAGVAKKVQQVRDEAAAIRAALEQEQAMADERNNTAMFDKWIDGINKAGNAEVEQIEKAIDAQRKRNEEIGRTKEQIESVQATAEIAATEELRAQLDSIDALLLKGQLITQDGVVQVEVSERVRAAYEAEAARIRDVIAAREQLAQLNQEGASLEKAFEAQKQYDKDWKDTFKTMEDGIYSALTGGSDKALKRMLNEFKQQFAKLILNPIVQPISTGIANMFNPLATQAGGAGGVAGAGGAGGTVSMVQSAANAYKALSGGFASFGSGVATNVGAGISSAGNWIGSQGVTNFGYGMQGFGLDGSLGAAGNAGSAAGSALGSVASALAGIAGGHFGGRAISNGYSAFGGSGNSAVNSGTAIGAVVGSVVPVIGTAIGALVGGLLGGAMNRLFGYKDKELTAMGMSGHLSDESAGGQSYSTWTQKGGVFRSDKKGFDVDPMSAGMINTLSSGLAQMKAVSESFAKTVGVTKDIGFYGKEFDLKYEFKKDEKGNITTNAEDVLKDFFSDVGDELALKLIPNIEEFARNGETASQTLERLSDSFKLTNDLAAALGRDVETMFGGKGLESEKNRTRLIDAAGGAGNLTNLINGYNTNFLTDEQKIAPLKKNITEALKELNLASVDTREEFKATVDALDLTTAADTKLFVSLMQLSEAFALVYEAAEDEKMSRKEIAEQRKELQNELDELTMTAAQLRDKERKTIHESNRSIFDRINALKDEKDALEKATERRKLLSSGAMTDVDDAMSALEKVVQREKDKLTEAHEAQIEMLDEQIKAQQDAHTKIKSIADSLRNALDGMGEPLENNAAFERSLASLQEMLKVVSNGGPLPTETGLKKALDGVGKIDKTSYASEQDYLRDFYKAKNVIGALAGNAGNKETIEEKTLKVLEKRKADAEKAHEAQIKVLDDVLANNQKMVDELKGQSISLLSIDGAVKALLNAIATARTDPIVAGTAAVNKTYETALGRPADSAGLDFWKNKLAEGVKVEDINKAISNSPEAQIRNMYKSLLGRDADAAGLDWFIKSGASMSDIRASIMGSAEYKGVPKFDVGTNYVPSDMLAQIHEGERIIPKADNRELMSAVRQGQAGGSNALMQELISEIRAFRAESKAGDVAVQRDTSVIANKIKRIESTGVLIREGEV